MKLWELLLRTSLNDKWVYSQYTDRNVQVVEQTKLLKCEK